MKFVILANLIDIIKYLCIILYQLKTNVIDIDMTNFIVIIDIYTQMHYINSIMVYLCFLIKNRIPVRGYLYEIFIIERE
jgi:hypothetical protein